MTGRDSAVVALGEAVKFESDGRDFYLQATEKAQNPLAKAVFKALAEDEKEHVRRVREIYEELKDKPGWPDVSAMVARHSGVVDAFEEAASNLRGAVAPDATAEDALRTAAGMEKKGLAFYRERVGKATCGAETEFFRRLVAEEEVHLRTIERVLGQVS
jgi:rubrerythrin